MHPSYQSNADPLLDLKFGLAAVMFVYVLLACYGPVLTYKCLKRHNKQNKSIKKSDRHPESEGKNQRCACLKWNSEILNKWLSRANCVAAGAFLAAGFLHVFVETMECVENAKKSVNITSEFPITSFLTMLGFFLVLGVEQIALEFYHKRVVYKTQSLETQQKVEDQPSPFPRNSISRSSRQSITFADIVQSVDANCSSDKFPTAPQHDHHDMLSLKSIQSGWISVLILLCALSLHSIFEGLAVGLCDTKSALLTLFGAITIHKFLIALSIGISIFSEMSVAERNKNDMASRRKVIIVQFLAVLMFAGSSPLGAVIGLALKSQPNTAEFLVSQAVLQGLACGTFLYVVFCELMPREFSELQGDKTVKFIFMILGFAAITLVIAFGPAD